MIAGDAKSICGCKIEDVGLTIRKLVLRSLKSRYHQSFITDPFAASMFRELTQVHRENHPAGEPYRLHQALLCKSLQCIAIFPHHDFSGFHDFGELGAVGGKQNAVRRLGQAQDIALADTELGQHLQQTRTRNGRPEQSALYQDDEADDE